MKKHFITGATGYVGRNLVKKLVARGDKVFILVRPSKKNLRVGYLESVFRNDLKKIKIFLGDVCKKNFGLSGEDLEVLKRQKIDRVWHLAAELSFSQNFSNKKRYKVNVLGTKNAVEFANYLGSVVCYSSTAYVAGRKRFQAESSDINQDFINDYERSKYLGEQAVSEKSRRGYIIFRPSAIIGSAIYEKGENCTFSYYRYVFLFYRLKQMILERLSAGGFWSMILNVLGVSLAPGGKLNFPSFVFPYPANAKVNLVPIAYVVKTMVKIADREDSFGRIYHLTHPKGGKLSFYMGVMLKELGIQNVKPLEVNREIFEIFSKLVYFLSGPWRGYIKSAMFYLPYVNTNTRFSRRNVNLYNKAPDAISEDFFRKINKEAFGKVFPSKGRGFSD